MNGLLVAAGPPYLAGERVDGSRVVDLAPTVLHLLGAPVGRDMEGVVLTDLLDPAGAVNAGFLDQLVPEGQAVDHALQTAGLLAKLPAPAYAGNKLVPRQQALAIMKASLAA